MSRPMRTTARRRRGFTLLELLLSIGMMAMISLMLFSSFSTAFRARASAAAQTTAVREAAVTLDLVQHDFQSAMAGNGALVGPFYGYALGTGDAEADSVSFYTAGQDTQTSADDPLFEGMRQVELVLSTGVDGKPSLVRRVRRNLLAPAVVDGVEETLAQNVRVFSVKYYDGESWHDEWDSTLPDTPGLPVAVQITIELDAPTVRDPSRKYRAMRVVPLACGISIANQTGGT